MISIVISSANRKLLQAVKRNIEKTIGVPYELLAFDNNKGQQSMCEVYNKGAWQAKYEIVCFMHEDIDIKTSDWGQVVIGLFEEHPLLGLVGVAGSSYKTLAPSGWVPAPGVDDQVYYANAIQQFKYTNKPPEVFYRNSDNKRLAKVACVDGLWFCTKKSYALEFPFDEKLLKGFHGYDVDFSLSISQKYDVAVTFDILIEHFSEGRFDETWFRNTLRLHKKWNHFLPLDRCGFSKKQIFVSEKKAFRYFFGQLAERNASVLDMFKVLWNTRVHKRISPVLLLKLYLDILKLSVKQ